MTDGVDQPVDVGPRSIATVELTRTQRLIWASQRLHPDVPLANMGKQFRIRGTLDPDRFVAAFDAVVRSCDALRMVVERSGRPGEERARILAHPPVATERIDLPVDDLERWGDERIATPIDAATCVYDSVLVRHGDDDWTWWLDLHHVAIDALGSSLVFTATSAAYERLGARAGDDDGDVVLDLADVVDGDFFGVARELEERPGGRGTPQERAAEWSADIDAAGPQGPLELYGARGPRTTAVDRVDLPLDADDRAALLAALGDEYRSISRELGLLTLSAMSVAIAVHRLDGRSSVVVGVPVHHRSSKVTRRLVGPLMELYPLVVDVVDDEPHREMFARTLRSVTTLLRRAKPGESPTAPFEVVLNVLTARYGDFAGLPTETAWMRSGHVDPSHVVRAQVFDYGADDSGIDESLRWELDLNRSLSADGAAERFPTHLSNAVRAVVHHPASTAGARPLVDAAEFAELAQVSPDPTARRLERPLHELIRIALREHPDRVVARHGGDAVTAAEFDRRADDVARWLADAGVTTGTAVGIRMERSIDVLVAVNAVLRAGGAFVMLAPDDPPARHDAIAADADLLLVLDELPTAITDVEAVEVPNVTPDDLAYVLYTSGSTGVPKGVPISHRGLADYLAFAMSAYATDDPPVVALHSALVFDLTITSLFLGLATGGCTIVFDGEPVAALAEVAADDRVTFLKATPSQLELYVRMVASDRPLEVVVVGGEAFRRPIAERVQDVSRPGVRIYNEYGPTEAVVGCMVHRWSPDLDTGVDVPIGHACPGSEVRIVDPAGHPTPTGAWGELFVRRPGMATGYLHRPEQSAERFVSLPRWRVGLDAEDAAGVDAPDTAGAPETAETAGAVWYRTGDRARIERPGVAVYGGRGDDQMKVNGIRLEPAEVEAAMLQIDGVESALVRVWHPTDRAGETVARCVRCGLGVDVPAIHLDDDGVCSTCRTFDLVAPQAEVWFRTEADLDERLVAARARRTGDIDCLHLLSGGKDSTYALYQLVERGWNVHALTLDNGFISDGAKENVRRSVADLGITHEFATADAMNEIFRDSLDRYSNVCQGCYKTIYTIAVARAREMGIPVIVTGLSRGQFFETRLVPHQFESGRFDPDEIDQTVLEARRVYHQTPDAVTELLPEQRVFDDLAVLDEIEFLDYYRYVDVDLAELYRFLEERAPWVRPADTGRSTNCLINVAGIQVHRAERGYHNYAEPYSWDVRLGHKTRDEALEELDDEVDDGEVARLLAEVGYQPKTNGVLTAWYVGADGHDLDPGEIRQALRHLLPEHAVPTAFVRIDEMPLAASAKADPTLLPAPQRFHRRGAGAVAPSTPLQRRLCAIWADVLGLDVVGVTDDFFDLGGASLDALEVVAAIDAEFGTDLHDAAVFRARTIRELADVVELAGAGGGRTPIPALQPDQPAPLSPGEEAMLFEYRADPTRTQYNVTRRYLIHLDDGTTFDADRFADAVRAVAEVHGPLHTSYDAARRVLPRDEAVSVVQLDPMDVAAFERFADDQRAVPFDLDDGPLVRVHTAPISTGEVAVLIGLHHISIDAGTFDLLWNQIVARYHTGALPEPSVTYAAHGSWQRIETAASRQFWLDAARERTERRPGGRLGVAVPAVAEPDGYLSRPLDLRPDELAATTGTPFAVALAAATVALGRFAGRNAVEFGVTASAKDHPDAAPLIGYYLNTLPMLLDAPGELPFSAVVERAAARVADVLAHRSYPFADIVRDARAEGLDVPAVSLMLAYEQLAPAPFPGGHAEHRILAAGTAVSDVTLFVQERVDRVQLGLEYRGAVVSAADAERLMSLFERVLVDGVRSPGRLVEALVDDPSATVDGPALDHLPPPTVLQRFAVQVLQAPTATAVIDATGDTITYAELGARALAVADEIRSRVGTAPGRVGVALDRSIDVVVAMLGAQFAGGAYVPLDPGAPAGRLELVAAAAELDLLIAADGSAAWAPVADRLDPTALRATAPTHDGSASIAARLATLADAIAPDTAAYVIFTSGSTGTPRGVQVSHANLAASNQARLQFYPDRPDRFLVTSSIGFDSSIVGLVWPLITGGAVVLPGDDDVRDVDRLGALVDDLGISHLLMVPSLYDALLARSSSALAGLSMAIVAGEACPAQLVTRHHELLPGVELVNEYGPTEATVWVAAQHLAPGEDPVRFGTPIAGATFRIVDEALGALPDGVAGELLVSSPGVVGGYLHGERPEVFVELAGRRWYRTGDLVRLEAGSGTFLGRIDDQLNVGGVRLEPGEVEHELERAPGVRAAVVVAVGDPPVLVGHVESDGLDDVALRSLLAERLPAASIPRRFVRHDELPRTSHGKLDRSAVAAMPLDVVAAEPAAVAADGSAVDRVVHRWRQVFDRPDIDADTDFFTIGGDSLMAVQLVVAVGEALDVDVPIAALLTGRTPAGLVQVLGLDDDVSPSAPTVADDSFQRITFREGTADGPLVLMTPAWDDVFGYRDLARAFGDDTRVEALAYVEQPGGPVVTTVAGVVDGFEATAREAIGDRKVVALIGWSVGGVVAVELAGRLATAGIDVRIVGLVDTFFPGEQHHRWSNRWWKYKSLLTPNALPDAIREARLTVVRRAKRLARSLGGRLVIWSGGSIADEPERTAVGTFPVASLDHELGRVAVPLVLYRASTTNPARTIVRWRTVAGELDDVVVPGRHRGFDSIMAEGRVERIAADLDARIH